MGWLLMVVLAIFAGVWLVNRSIWHRWERRELAKRYQQMERDDLWRRAQRK